MGNGPSAPPGDPNVWTGAFNNHTIYVFVFATSGALFVVVALYVIIRSVILRKRFTRRIEQASREGVLTSEQAGVLLGGGFISIGDVGGVVSGRRSLGGRQPKQEKPKIWDVCVAKGGHRLCNLVPLAASMIPKEPPISNSAARNSSSSRTSSQWPLVPPSILVPSKAPPTTESDQIQLTVIISLPTPPPSEFTTYSEERGTGICELGEIALGTAVFPWTSMSRRSWVDARG